MSHATLILTLSGSDRPGLVQEVARVITEHDGNWTQSRMVNLAQRFVGLLEVHADRDRVDAMCAALRALPDLEMTLHIADDWSRDVAEPMTLELVGGDQLGIIRRITGILTEAGFNIEELTSATEAAPDSGAAIFRAKMRLSGGSAERFEQVRGALEALAHDLMIDLRLDA